MAMAVLLNSLVKAVRLLAALWWPVCPSERTDVFVHRRHFTRSSFI